LNKLAARAIFFVSSLSIRHPPVRRLVRRATGAADDRVQAKPFQHAAVTFVL